MSAITGEETKAEAAARLAKFNADNPVHIDHRRVSNKTQISLDKIRARENEITREAAKEMLIDTLSLFSGIGKKLSQSITAELKGEEG